jgi:dTDP-4-dehydrorhamnose 3,5-epimerase
VSTLNFQRLEIPEVVLIEPMIFEDARGFFMETYKHSVFESFGIPERFVQDNHSKSIKGVLRGLHYQKSPKAQGKLVRVVAGEIFDVAVDIRKDSQTYGKWVGIILSAQNRKMLYVPPEFAHGFCALSDGAEVIYKTTDEYAPAEERGIVWNDPDLGITWPVDQPIVSVKDAVLPRFEAAENGF